MENGFRGYHPFIIFFYYICVGSLAMFFKHPLFLLTAVFLLIALNLMHDRGQALRKWAPALFTMSALIIILNPFLNSRGSHILFYFRGKQVTLEATIYGVVMSLSIVAVLIMFVSFNDILNGNKLLFVFARILPRTAFLIMLTVRFVPLLKRRLDEIYAVQRVRGMTLHAGTIRERMRSGMLMLHILLTWSLEEAIQTADSMKARGYGIGHRVSYVPYRMEKRDWFWLSALIILYVVCLTGGFLGYGKIVIYPQLGTLHLFIFDWITFGSMVILYSFPLLVEGREQLRWKFSQ